MSRTGAITATPGLPLRSWSNLRDTFAILGGRLAKRQPRYPSLPWTRWTAIWLVAILAAFFTVDTPAGTLWGQWPGTLKEVAETVTDIGLSGWYLIPAAAVLLIVNLIDWRARSRRGKLMAMNWTGFAFFALCSVGLSGIAVNVLKYGFGRARPLNFGEFGVLSLHPLSFDARFASFPSGHATTMGAVFGVALLVFPRWRYPALAVTALIASARIFVGAHYPSDTVAGFGLGLAFAIGCALVFARLGFVFQVKDKGLPALRRSFRLV